MLGYTPAGADTYPRSRPPRADTPEQSPPRSRHSPQEQIHPPAQCMLRDTGGMHPTGMHTCCNLLLHNLRSNMCYGKTRRFTFFGTPLRSLTLDGSRSASGTHAVFRKFRQNNKLVPFLRNPLSSAGTIQNLNIDPSSYFTFLRFAEFTEFN